MKFYRRHYAVCSEMKIQRVSLSEREAPHFVNISKKFDLRGVWLCLKRSYGLLLS